MKQWFISIHREITDHWIYNEKRIFSRFEAWIYILLEVNHKDNKFLLWNELIECKRWSMITSELKLMNIFSWSKTKLRAFLKNLGDDKMISIHTDKKKTTIFVLNYDKYQVLKTTKEPQKDQEKTIKKPQKDTNNNVNNDNNINNNNISKDISLLEDESSSENLQVVETFWNDEINKMQDIIKNTIESLDMIYKPWKYERPRIKNIISWKDFWVVCEKHWMSRSDFVISIINLASKLKYAKKINNAVDFYENYASVYNLALQTKKWFLENKREIW